MKGFIRILEAVIASFIILIALTYFLSAPPAYQYWGDALLGVQAQDALASLYRSSLLTTYIENNDITGLNDTLTDMLPEVADFSVEIKGIPNPIIYIGCDCTDAEMNDLNKSLSSLDFIYKGRAISIRMKKDMIENIDPRTNIYFICGYRDLKNNENEVNDFLLNDGTIFMLSNLERRVQVEDGTLNNIFGLKWKDVIASVDGKFYNYNDVTKKSHWIRNYFLELGGNESKISFGDSNKIDYDERTIIIDDNNQLSHVKINELTYGRTVWFADYDKSNDDMNKLLKAVILWASGEKYRMDPSYKTVIIEKLKNSNIPYTEADYLTPDYEVRLRVWSIFY